MWPVSSLGRTCLRHIGRVRINHSVDFLPALPNGPPTRIVSDFHALSASDDSREFGLSKRLPSILVSWPPTTKSLRPREGLAQAAAREATTDQKGRGTIQHRLTDSLLRCLKVALAIRDRRKTLSQLRRGSFVRKHTPKSHYILIDVAENLALTARHGEKHRRSERARLQILADLFADTEQNRNDLPREVILAAVSFDRRTQPMNRWVSRHTALGCRRGEAIRKAKQSLHRWSDLGRELARNGRLHRLPLVEVGQRQHGAGDVRGVLEQRHRNRC